ncbi:hypothetical protein ACH429_05190 [Streptomyces pathocidini]|uniref:Uncharacterized protein n=1 Tax=Streptomyces pathocidini TaxID=1650571 RepID=A0ABW7UP72_9ACTN|nr:hypothetical protein [Streptomyces pathocidini]
MAEEKIDQVGYDYQAANMCFNERHTTNFAGGRDMDQMKAMVANANPDAVKKVADGWMGLRDELAGGDGSVKADFDKAVAHILQHWEGASAERFSEHARQISKSLQDCSEYARYTSVAMRNAGEVLGRIKPEVDAMEKPSGFSSAMNSLGDGFTRSDEGLNNDLKGGKGAQEALDRNHDDLSAGRERQLEMAAKMETLGAAYQSQAKAMGSWNRKTNPRDDEEYPGEPGGTAPTPVVMPTAPSPRTPKNVSPGVVRSPQTGSISPSKPAGPPRDSGITGGAQKPVAPKPQVGTAIDGITSTVGGGPTPGAPSTAPGGGTPVGGGPASGAGPVSTGGTVKGGATTGRSGVAGRPGAGGMGGAAGAAKGGAAGARSGGMARQRGGVVGGAARAAAGAAKGTAGGSGLHRSRGAAAGSGAASRKGGVAGVPGARNGRPNEEESREGERPDYLIEDEETWTPQRNVAPRVIE